MDTATATTTEATEIAGFPIDSDGYVIFPDSKTGFWVQAARAWRDELSEFATCDPGDESAWNFYYGEFLQLEEEFGYDAHELMDWVADGDAAFLSPTGTRIVLAS